MAATTKARSNRTSPTRASATVGFDALPPLAWPARATAIEATRPSPKPTTIAPGANQSGQLGPRASAGRSGPGSRAGGGAEGVAAGGGTAGILVEGERTLGQIGS